METHQCVVQEILGSNSSQCKNFFPLKYNTIQIGTQPQYGKVFSGHNNVIYIYMNCTQKKVPKKLRLQKHKIKRKKKEKEEKRKWIRKEKRKERKKSRKRKKGCLI